MYLNLPVFLGSLSVATPLARESTCTPSFKGVGVSIAIGDRSFQEWGLPSPPTSGTVLSTEQITDGVTEYRMSQSASDTAASFYGFMPANALDADMTVGTLANGTLALASISATDSTQQFNIACNVCQDVDPTTFNGRFASGCTIKPTSNDNQCIMLSFGTNGSPSNRLTLQECTGETLQSWEFRTIGKP